MCHCLAVTLHGLSIASQGNKKPTKKDTKMKEFVHTFHVTEFNHFNYYPNSDTTFYLFRNSAYI